MCVHFTSFLGEAGDSDLWVIDGENLILVFVLFPQDVSSRY